MHTRRASRNGISTAPAAASLAISARHHSVTVSENGVGACPVAFFVRRQSASAPNRDAAQAVVESDLERSIICSESCGNPSMLAPRALFAPAAWRSAAKAAAPLGDRRPVMRVITRVASISDLARICTSIRTIFGGNGAARAVTLVLFDAVPLVPLVLFVEFVVPFDVVLRSAPLSDVSACKRRRRRSICNAAPPVRRFLPVVATESTAAAPGF